MTPMVDIDARVTNLEQLCMQMNTNISSMQTIIQALQERDYVTNVAEIKEGEEVIGYAITFAKNPSITIYKGNDGKDGKDGKDGVDGKDGKDGEDGITPQIGVAIDGDVYYWTLNGEWLLDAGGNKLRVTGENGKDGQDGEDGKDGKDGQDGENGKDGADGTDGEDGTDGVTPQLKIENDYWYISYNNGTSWTQLGKAKGDKGDKGATGATGAAGKDGADGKDGQDGADGDSMFKSVTQDDNYVYFVLADDTEITIAKNGSKEAYHIGFGTESGPVSIVNGAIQAAFSVSATQKVYFSMGNLEFNASKGTHTCATGTTQSGTWRFAIHQYDANPESGWMNTFCWATSGWNCYAPKYKPTDIDGQRYDYGPRQSQSSFGELDLTGNYVNSDWGYYNAISNGGNQTKQWRTLSADEWKYLLFERSHAKSLQSRARLQINDEDFYYGLLILPDNIYVEGLKFVGSATSYDANIYSSNEWTILEQAGAVFLPTINHADMAGINYNGRYWSSTHEGQSSAYCVAFALSDYTSDYNSTISVKAENRNYQYAIRVVKNIK